MSSVTITEVSLQDMPRLMLWREEVLREVFHIPSDAHIDALMEANRVYYAAALPTGEHVACFIQRDGETLGCGGFCLQNELPSPDNDTGLCAYLMNIYVRPAFRGEGVGKSLVHWLIEKAKAQGAKKIYLETTQAGRPLYQHMQFEEMRDIMRLRMDIKEVDKK